jgi:type I restriction enzyme S subunit
VSAGCFYRLALFLNSDESCIAEILGDMDTEIAALEGKLSKARQVKQGMMQELLTGKTRLV